MTKGLGNIVDVRSPAIPAYVEAQYNAYDKALQKRGSGSIGTNQAETYRLRLISLFSLDLFDL